LWTTRTFQPRVPKSPGPLLLGLWTTRDPHHRLLQGKTVGKRLARPPARGTGGTSAEHPTLTTLLRYEGGRIVASITIESMPLVATIDTGASHSFVSETVARGLTTARTQRTVCTRISLADGSRRDVTQALMVCIQLGQRQVTIPMLVLPTILDDVILGMDFLFGVAAELRCGQAGTTANASKAHSHSHDNPDLAAGS